MKPDYWDAACRELSRGDPFQTLARSIVGQQISVKAAQAVWDRVLVAACELSPERIGRMRASTLQRCGLSQRKVEYVKDLAAHFRSGEVNPAHWSLLDDEAIIGELVKVRGIGRWTAEMFLIFNLLRPDVFPVDDLGLLKAIGLHYGGTDGTESTAAVAGRAAREHAIRVGARFRPWRTVATWYLWRSLDPVPVDY